MFSSNPALIDVPELTKHVSLPDVISKLKGLEPDTESFVESLDVFKKKKDQHIFDLRTACLENWFARSAWYHKLHFIINLLELSEGLTLLVQLLKSISTCNTKDVLYVANQRSHIFEYDHVPLDDDRELDLYTLSDARTLDKMWFVSLDVDEQLSLLTDLLRVGGGALTFRVFNEAANLLAYRKQMNLFANIIRMRDSQASTGTDTEADSEIIHDKTLHFEMEDREMESIILSGRTSFTDVLKKVESGRSEIPVTDEEICLTKELAEKENEWQNLMKTLEENILCDNKMQKQDKKEIKTKRQKKQKQAKLDHTRKDYRDMVQMLPLSVNRAIAKLLDKETAETAKKVNSYWAIMIDDAQQEKDARENLNSIIKSLQHLRAMACGPVRHLMAVSVEKHSVQLYTLLTGCAVGSRLEGHMASITCMAFLPEGNHIVTGSKDMTLRCWDICSYVATKVYQGHEGAINALSVSDEYVASASQDKCIKVFHVWSGHCISTMCEEHPVTAVSLLASRKFIYSGCQEGEIKIYDYKTQTFRSEIVAHDGTVTALCLSPPLLVSSSVDGFVKVWGSEELGQGCWLMVNHCSPVTSVNIFCRQVLSGCHNGQLRVWSIETGALIRLIHPTPETRPIRNIHCIKEEDHVKIVTSAETGVTIYEFHPHPHPQKMLEIEKSHTGVELIKPTLTGQYYPMSKAYTVLPQPSAGRFHPGIRVSTLGVKTKQPERVTLATQRMSALGLRGTTDSSLRFHLDVPSTTKSVITEALNLDPRIFKPESGSLMLFPRMVISSESHATPLAVPHANWTDSKSSKMSEKCPSLVSLWTRGRKFKKPSSKNVLEIYSSFKTSM